MAFWAARGQSSLEYLLITSFLLIVTGIIFAYTTATYAQTSDLGLAKSAVASIGNAAEQTYAFGEGSVLFTEVEVPSTIVDVRTEYVCKNEFVAGKTVYGALYPGCNIVDPDQTCCNLYDVSTQTCASWTTTRNDSTLPAECFNWISEDRGHSLSADKSYLVFTVSQNPSNADLFRLVRGFVELSAQAKDALQRSGRLVLKVEWDEHNGKIYIKLPGE